VHHKDGTPLLALLMLLLLQQLLPCTQGAVSASAVISTCVWTFDGSHCDIQAAPGMQLLLRNSVQKPVKGCSGLEAATNRMLT
jgi:hypothetical protein